MSQTNSLETIQIKIDNLNNIIDWKKRLDTIKDIKEDINNETEYVNNILESLDNHIPIKVNEEGIAISTPKKYDINKIINNFDKVDLSKKIKYYQYLNNYIKNIENELFI